jgi:glucosylceramidase
MYTWDLLKHYFRSGVVGYMYWNISLITGGMSHWGWPQNSFLTVDPDTKKFSYNNDYFVFKHASHFVRPQAARLSTSGTFDDALAFHNYDGSIAVLLRNAANTPAAVDITAGLQTVSALLDPDSISTILIPPTSTVIRVESNTGR